MAIKIVNRTPKITELSGGDIIVNSKDGTLFYRSQNDLFKLQGDKISTPDITEFLSDNLIKGNLNVSGSIIPLGSGSFDLGSSDNPWKDLHITTESIKFYDEAGEVGKVSFEREKGLRIVDDANDLTIISASLGTFTTRIKSPTGSFDHYIGNINGGSF